MKDSSHLIKGKKGTKKKKKAMGTSHQDTEESRVVPISLPPSLSRSSTQPCVSHTTSTGGKLTKLQEVLQRIQHG